MSLPVACYPGTYSATGYSPCSPCPTNMVSDVSKSTSCKWCGGGKYPAADKRMCLTCPLGTYSQYGLYETTPGYTCSATCPAGTYAAVGTQICYQCGPGKYNPNSGATSSSACLLCPQGTYYSASTGKGTSACNTCGMGTYNSKRGSITITDCLKCAYGTYGPTYGAAECTPCPLDTYGPSIGLTKCTPCPSYKPMTSSTGKADISDCGCTSGYYPGTTFTNACTACPVGTYNPNRGERYSVGSTSSTYCQPCPAGTYGSSTGLAACSKCSRGTINLNTGSTSESACTYCQAGTENLDASLSSVCTSCNPGTYSYGNGVCLECEQGSFTPDTGSIACILCPGGTYSPNPGATASSACLPCPTGEFSGNGYGVCAICSSGTYNDLENQTSCKPCPGGTYNPNTWSKSLSACVNCLPGKYSLGGASSCTSCNPGTYNSLYRQSSCQLCPETTYNPKTGSSLASDCINCGTGLFSLAGSTNVSQCITCLAGSFINMYGECLSCNPGYYSTAINAKSCTMCDFNTYSDQYGSTSCTSCPSNTLTAFKGTQSVSDCKNCPVGQFLSSFGTCYPCYAGTYNNTPNQRSCTSCPAGTYSGDGASACILCPINTYFSGSNGTSASVCAPCGDDLYSQAGSSSYASCTPIQAVTTCTPSQFYNFETKQCEFKDLALSCIGKSTDDCISSTYQGTNAAKVNLTDYVYSVEPITFVDTKVLPQGLQDTMSTCEGDCKFIAADFTAQTFDKKSDIPYTINTLTTTAENKAVITSESSDTPINFKSPPGFAINDYAITQGTQLVNAPTTLVGQDSCSVACIARSDCAGFNLNAGTNTCEFFTSVGSEEYIDSKLSFRKENIPTTLQSGSAPSYPGTNLDAQGLSCTDMIACNSNVRRVLDDTTIAAFTTGDLQACDYCPIRKFDRPTNTVTDEFGKSTHDRMNMFFKGQNALHVPIINRSFYVMTPYIPTSTGWYHNIFVKKPVNSDKFQVISGELNVNLDNTYMGTKTRIMSIQRLIAPKNSSFKSGCSFPYPIQGSNSVLSIFTINTPDTFEFIPCDYVNDGFMIKNSNGQFVQFYNGNISVIDQVQMKEKFTEEYNRCIFFMTPSDIGSFLTEYKTNTDYFLPPNNLIRYDSGSNRLKIINSAISKDYFSIAGQLQLYYSTVQTDRTYPGVGTIDNTVNGYFTIYSPYTYDNLITIDQDLVDTGNSVILAPSVIL